MGTVYVVEHVHTGEHLAMKVLLAQVGASQEHIERFKREARASARIKSEHVVRVTDSDVAAELNGAPFLVMELLEGADLDTLTHDEPVAPSTVLEWLRQVARALDKAHGLGLVHRDLKPENLFLTRREDGTPLVKILDYGLVKMVENAAGQTQTGEILGTPRYMAPEQARGDVEQIGPGTDRWALGLIAYKFLTGDDYWTAKTVHHLLAQIVYEEVAPPSSRGAKLGPAFDAWFATACNREPERRFSSAAEQVEALAEALGAPTLAVVRASDSGGGASLRASKRPPDPADHAATLRASSVETFGIPKRTSPALLAGGAVAALLLASGATYLLTRKDPGKTLVAVTASATTLGAASAPPPPPVSASVAPDVSVAPTSLPAGSSPVAEPPVPPGKRGAGSSSGAAPIKSSGKAAPVKTGAATGPDPLNDQR
jgi:serine/threonine-protein kinase